MLTELEWELAKRLLLAMGCGAVIGIERELRKSPAGLRTHALVCMGSALFTIASFLVTGPNVDASRIAAQVAVGMGFIGGGIIVKSRDKVLGVATAADLWAVAGLGLIIGLGAFRIAFIATLLIVGILTFGYFFERRAFQKKEY